MTMKVLEPNRRIYFLVRRTYENDYRGRFCWHYKVSRIHYNKDGSAWLSNWDVPTAVQRICIELAYRKWRRVWRAPHRYRRQLSLFPLGPPLVVSQARRGARDEVRVSLLPEELAYLGMLTPGIHYVRETK